MDAFLKKYFDRTSKERSGFPLLKFLPKEQAPAGGSNKGRNAVHPH